MKNPSDLPGGSVPQWTLGDRLRKARVWAGIDRAAMADDIGMTDRTISNYELDQTRVPKLVVQQYALRTGVPIEWLFTGEAPAESPDGGVPRSILGDTRRYVHRFPQILAA